MPENEPKLREQEGAGAALAGAAEERDSASVIPPARWRRRGWDGRAGVRETGT